MITTEVTASLNWSPPMDGIQVIRAKATSVQRDLGVVQAAIARLKERTVGKGSNRFFRLLADLVLPVFHSSRWDLLPSEIEARAGKCDLIIATGPVWNTFDLAAQLSSRWDATLLLDYRDPWNALDPAVALHSLNWHGKGLAGWLKMKRSISVERRIVQQANGITATSPAYLANALRFCGNKPSRVIYNGFRSRKPERTAGRNPKLTLLYAGKLYMEQDWDLIMKGLEIVRSESAEIAEGIEIQLWGADMSDTEKMDGLKDFGRRTRMMRFFPATDRGSFEQIQQNADILLSVISEGNRGQIPLKLIDYLGLAAPILLTGHTRGVQQEILEDTKRGRSISTARELAEFLVAAHTRWSAGEVLAEPGDLKMLEKFKIEDQMGSWFDLMLQVHQEHIRATA